MGILRVILAISIVITHSESFFGFRLVHGVAAVQIFFIMSGFYMTMILDKKYRGKGSYALFLSNRFLRLYPMYWTILFLAFILSLISFLLFDNWFILSSYGKYFHIISFETFLFQIFTNLAVFGQDIALFLGMNPETGTIFFTSNFQNSDPKFYSFLLIPQAWSLGIEVVFYLIAPFIVRRKNLSIIIIIVSSLFIRLLTYFMGYQNDPWTYRFFPFELALFLLGTISYRIYQSRPKIIFSNKSNQYLVAILFFTILIFYDFIPTNSGHLLHIKNWALYIITSLALPFIFELSKLSKYDLKLGEFSYPIYISHLLIIDLISPFLSSLKLQEYQGEFTILLTLILSHYLIKFISEPIEKIRQSRVKVQHMPKQAINIRNTDISRK
ncbi:MAG: acyltransferase [Cyanobacteria bacterium P01_A01_bin.45]